MTGRLTRPDFSIFLPIIFLSSDCHSDRLIYNHERLLVNCNFQITEAITQGCNYAHIASRR